MLTRLSQTELILNMEVTAQKATGRAVTVRIRKPYGASGRAGKSLTGEIVIDLDPAIFQNINHFAKIFCHELAHVVLHHGQMERADLDAPPKVRTDREYETLVALAQKVYPEINKRESEAEALAAKFMDVVHEHYWGYQSAVSDPVLAVLKILYHQVGAKYARQ